MIYFESREGTAKTNPLLTSTAICKTRGTWCSSSAQIISMFFSPFVLTFHVFAPFFLPRGSLLFGCPDFPTMERKGIYSGTFWT